MLSKKTPHEQYEKKIKDGGKKETPLNEAWLKKAAITLSNPLDVSLPYALGIFEESPFEKELIGAGLFAGEAVLKKQWQVAIAEIIGQTQLRLPAWDTLRPVNGGRIGKHSEHLQPLLTEMGEVFNIDPGAEW